MLRAPTSTAPAAARRRTIAASAVAGGRSRSIFDPAMVTNPATSNRFFTANGTPASGPGSSPRASATSTARASASARASVTAVKLLRAGSRAAMRASVASATSTALGVPPRTRAMRRVKRQPDQRRGGVDVAFGVKRAIGQGPLLVNLLARQLDQRSASFEAPAARAPQDEV